MTSSAAASAVSATDPVLRSPPPPGRRLSLLALDTCEAWPATDGGRESVHGAIQSLARHADLMYACPGWPADAATAAHYAAIGIDYRPVPHVPRDTPGVVLSATLQGKPFKFYKYCTPQAERLFDAAIGDLRPDALICFHAHTEELGQRLKRRRGWRIPLLVREQNIEYEMWSSYRAALPRAAWPLLTAMEALTRRAEQAIWRRADMTAFITERDLAVARASGVAGAMMLAPEGVPIPPLRVARRPAGPTTQLLIPLNRHAPQSVANMRLFLHGHWTAVAGREPLAGVGLRVTGVDPAQLAELSGMDPATQRRLRVDAVGFLPSLAPAFASSLALVAPTFVGSGIRKKILEGMANQLPIIATDFDIDTSSYFTPGQNLLRMGTPDEFAEAVTRLLRDEALWQRLSVNARATVERHASWERFAQVMLATLTDLTEAGPRGRASG